MINQSEPADTGFSPLFRRKKKANRVKKHRIQLIDNRDRNKMTFDSKNHRIRVNI